MNAFESKLLSQYGWTRRDFQQSYLYRKKRQNNTERVLENKYPDIGESDLYTETRHKIVQMSAVENTPLQAVHQFMMNVNDQEFLCKVNRVFDYWHVRDHYKIDHLLVFSDDNDSDDIDSDDNDSDDIESDDIDSDDIDSNDIVSNDIDSDDIDSDDTDSDDNDSEENGFEDVDFEDVDFDDNDSDDIDSDAND